VGRFDDDDDVTLSTLNTRKGVAKKKVVQSHSSYWLDMDEWEEEDDPNSIDKAIRLAAVRRAVANFVGILTNDSKINVVFNEANSSYTDGNTVVIAAQDKPKDFDVMVGLALHEAAHCVHTDISFYGALTHPSVYFGCHAFMGLQFSAISELYHPAFRHLFAPNMDAPLRDLFEKVMLMLNVVEDRRIDQYVYNTAVGYRPYYGALYKKYFLSTAIDKALKSGTEWNDPTDIDSYINRLINVMNPHTDSSALPGLDKMMQTFDVENIHRLSDYHPSEEVAEFMREAGALYNYVMHSTTASRSRNRGVVHSPNVTLIERTMMAKKVTYHDMPPTWILANELLAQVVSATGYTFGNVQQQPPQPQPTPDKSGEGEGEGEGEYAGEGLGEESNDNVHINGQVVPDGAPVAAPPSNARLKKAVAAQREFLAGKLRKKKIASKLNDMVQQVEEASAEIVEVGSKTTALGKVRAPCVVIKNVTKQVMLADWFLFGPSANSYYGTDYVTRQNAPYIKAGVRMGQVLAQRLSIRNDPTITHYTRQNNGKIDRRILSQLGMDITNVFKRTRTDKYKPVTLYLSLDASGSMNGKKWGKALAVATALSYLADKSPDINVVVMVRGGSDVATVAVLHDSRKQKFVVGRQILELSIANGGTPESLCYEATLSYIQDKEKSSDVYFINFSDGEPSFSIRDASGGANSYGWVGFSGNTAVDHCRQVMNIYREYGVKVLSYFISHSDDAWGQVNAKETFKRMYGESAQFVNVENVGQVLKTLQKLLSDKSTMEAAYT
jgi:hypothetical protein